MVKSKSVLNTTRKNVHQNKLVIQQNPPSIPYKDSSYGYEPIDDTGQLLINVGNSFKQTYKKQYDATPGPGAYDLAKKYLSNNKSKVLSYKRDSTKRSNAANSQSLGPAHYNLLKKIPKYQTASKLGNITAGRSTDSTTQKDYFLD